jgi:hypothetical protein
VQLLGAVRVCCVFVSVVFALNVVLLDLLLVWAFRCCRFRSKHFLFHQVEEWLEERYGVLLFRIFFSSFFFPVILTNAKKVVQVFFPEDASGGIVAGFIYLFIFF